MNEINNEIQEDLAKIPPIFSKITLQIVQRDLTTFFSSPYRPAKLRAPNSISYPILLKSHDCSITIEERNYIENALNLRSPQSFY